jgi:hypothetical protein
MKAGDILDLPPRVISLAFSLQPSISQFVEVLS